LPAVEATEERVQSDGNRMSTGYFCRSSCDVISLHFLDDLGGRVRWKYTGEQVDG